MTARAKFAVSIANIDQGWTYGKTEGDTSPSLAVEPVQLMDGLKVTWGYDKYPGQPTPTIITAQLLVATAADLPELATGDFLDVAITRPKAGGGSWTWLSDRFVADEPVISNHERGLVLTLTLVHWVRQLGEMTVNWHDPINDENASLSPFSAEAQIMLILRNLTSLDPNDHAHPSAYDVLQIGYRMHSAHLYGMPQVTFSKVAPGTALLELVTKALEGVGHDKSTEADQVVFRLMTPAQMSALDLANGGNGHDSGAGVWYDSWWGTDAQGTMWWAYFAKLSRTATVGACLQLAAVSNVVQRQATATPPSSISGLVLDGADVLADDVQFRRSRDDAVNQISLKGYSFDPLTRDSEGVETTASHPEVAERYGTNTRQVDSQIGVDDLPNAAASLLPAVPDALPRWTTEQFTWTTRDLTDAELDHYAPLWYPPVALPDPASGQWVRDMSRPLALLNMDPDKAVAGPLLDGHLTGAVLTFSGGEVTVQGSMQTRKLPAAADAITWAQLRASGVSAAVYRAAAGLEWDASGHAGATQLTPADLRLVKA